MKRKFSEWLKTKIRTWLQIEAWETFAGLDLGWQDQTAIVIVKRSSSGRNDQVKIYTFSPQTPFSDVRKKCDQLAKEFGISNMNFFANVPKNGRGFYRDYI